MIDVPEAEMLPVGDVVKLVAEDAVGVVGGEEVQERGDAAIFPLWRDRNYEISYYDQPLYTP